MSQRDFWTWDPHRKKYFYIDKDGTYRYEDGRVLDRHGNNVEHEQNSYAKRLEDDPDVNSNGLAAFSNLSVDSGDMSACSPQFMDERASGSRSRDHDVGPSTYRRQRMPEQFFRVGKVIKVPWPEYSSSSSISSQRGTSAHGSEQRLFESIRWFIVVKTTSNLWSLCVPIVQYTPLRSHVYTPCAIVFTGQNPPAPQGDENNLEPPLRILPRRKKDELPYYLSRVNYGKVYTIEHNVEVSEFGVVDDIDLDTFRSTWERVFLASHVDNWTQPRILPLPLERGYESDLEGSEEEPESPAEAYRTEADIVITNLETKTRHTVNALFDTGANRNTISKSIREACKLDSYRNPKPRRLKMGNGTISQVQSYCLVTWAVPTLGASMQSRFWILDDSPHDIIVGKRDTFDSGAYQNNLAYGSARLYRPNDGGAEPFAPIHDSNGKTSYSTASKSDKKASDNKRKKPKPKSKENETQQQQAQQQRVNSSTDS